MSYAFARSGPIFVVARLESERQYQLCRFVLDTGAERSILSRTTALDLESALVQGGNIWTASRMEPVEATTLKRIDSLGLLRRDFPVLVARLPAALRVDGLLGLDFFRDARLTIDFRQHVIVVD